MINSGGLQGSVKKLVMLLPDEKTDFWMVSIWHDYNYFLIAYFLT